jgi:hypothetical protein
MKSNLFLSLTMAIALAIASARAQAQSEIVIGNFEGASNSNTDGWTGQNGATVANFNNPPLSPSPATNGTGALVVTPQNAGFTWAIQLDNNARPTLGADLLSHPILKADVTWIGSQWGGDLTADPNDNWSKWDIVAVNDTTGWQQWSASGDPANPSFPGSWDTNQPNRTTTVSWDLRGGSNGPALQVDPSGFVQLWISVNMSNTSWTSGKPFWIDNIRLASVPEPTSLGLAGVAAVGLFARRRRLA